jgi:hypothetical protein
MAATNAPLFSFNRGEVSRYAMARVDLERLRLSAEEQINWAPFVMGPMMLRPGMEYIGGTKSDLAARNIPFVFSNSDVARLELTALLMRISINDVLLSRASVSSAVTNGDFSSATGWTLAGTTATITGGKLTLANATLGSIATCARTVTVSGGDQGVEHAFRVVVERGPVTFRAGTAAGLDDLVTATALDTGVHSLAFTPNVGTVYIQFETTTSRQKIVDSVTIESAGTVEIATTWSADDLRNVRFDQSGDVIFCACYGQQQTKIERRSTRSWSVVRYYQTNGPFAGANSSDTTLTPSVLKGNGTLTASRSFFKSTNVGSVFRLFSAGQNPAASISAQNTWTTAIRVSGVGADRTFNYSIAGTWAGTWKIQRSFVSESSGFTDLPGYYGTGNSASSYSDGLDNQIIWYRIGFDTGTYTSGTADFALTYSGGGAAGLGRVTAYTSPTVVDIEVIADFSSLDPTNEWNESDWSPRRGWPSTVGFHDGRLFWFGGDRIWGSESDEFYNYGIDGEGDAQPINRSFGSGPVDRINWALSLTRLIVGREGQEASVRSSSFDEPLTSSNVTIKDCSSQGSAKLPAVKVDTRGIFVQKSGRKVYQLFFDVNAQDYTISDLTRLNPDIGEEGFVSIAVQRQPDTRIHLVRGDGTAAMLTFDANDQVDAWWRIETDGEIEDVCILPGMDEDQVYYVIKRTIGMADKRFVEKCARWRECIGGNVSKLADSFVAYSGSPTATISAPHLEGKQVVVWAEGVAYGPLTIASGVATLPATVSSYVAGLAYQARFKSAKLAYAAQRGTALAQKKKIDKLALLLANTHMDGIYAGPSYDRLNPLPGVVNGQTVSANTVHEEIDFPMTGMPGVFDTDSRLHLVANAPKPAMVKAAVIGIETHDK